MCVRKFVKNMKNNLFVCFRTNSNKDDEEDFDSRNENNVDVPSVKKER